MAAKQSSLDSLLLNPNMPDPDIKRSRAMPSGTKSHQASIKGGNEMFHYRLIKEIFNMPQLQYQGEFLPLIIVYKLRKPGSVFRLSQVFLRGNCILSGTLIKCLYAAFLMLSLVYTATQKPKII